MFSSRLDHKGLDKRARIGGGVTVQPPTKGVIASSHFSHECAGQSHYESRAEYQTVRMTSVVFFGTSGKVMRTRRIVRPAIRSTVNISRSKLMRSPGPVRIVIGVDGSPDANNWFRARHNEVGPKEAKAALLWYRSRGQESICSLLLCRKVIEKNGGQGRNRTADAGLFRAAYRIAKVV